MSGSNDLKSSAIKFSLGFQIVFFFSKKRQPRLKRQHLPNQHSFAATFVYNLTGSVFMNKINEDNKKGIMWSKGHVQKLPLSEYQEVVYIQNLEAKRGLVIRLTKHHKHITIQQPTRRTVGFSYTVYLLRTILYCLKAN